MTAELHLRDHFAAKVLHAFVTENFQWQRDQERRGITSPHIWSEKEIAVYAYQFADAMMMVRVLPDPEQALET